MARVTGRTGFHMVRSRWSLALAALLLACPLGTYSQESDWETTLNHVRPAVVQVFGQTDRWTTCGSGVVISPHGYILTASHVLEDARLIVVVLKDGREYEASVVRTHQSMDVGLLRIMATGLTPIRFGNAAELDDGAKVWILGHPGCAEELVVAQGNVGRTSENRPMGTLWYDAPVRQGHSGGPVLNAAGELVAVHFEQPAAEGGGRAVSAQEAIRLIPMGVLSFADWVTVSEPVAPGDVLEIDPTGIGQYRLARGPCTVSVAGVVSTAPGIVLGGDLVLGSGFEVLGEDQALLALLGVVPVKVTDEGGTIAVGDLLIVSSTPGHAMRWDPDSGEICGLVGKALEPHEEGESIIEVLLTR